VKFWKGTLLAKLCFYLGYVGHEIRPTLQYRPKHMYVMTDCFPLYVVYVSVTTKVHCYITHRVASNGSMIDA
jgi:hypothetical protein